MFDEDPLYDYYEDEFTGEYVSHPEHDETCKHEPEPKKYTVSVESTEDEALEYAMSQMGIFPHRAYDIEKVTDPLGWRVFYWVHPSDAKPWSDPISDPVKDIMTAQKIFKSSAYKDFLTQYTYSHYYQTFPNTNSFKIITNSA